MRVGLFLKYDREIGKWSENSEIPDLWGRVDRYGFQSSYAPAYSKNSGRALSVTPVRPVRTSVRSYVPLSCPDHNSKTLYNIFMKLHRCIHHNNMMCHEQGRQLMHFWFLHYFPLTGFHIVNPVWAITPKLYGI